MKYSHIQRCLSAALLLAFMAPSGIAYTTYDAYNHSTTPIATSTELSGNVQLTQANDKITLSLRDSDVKQVLRMFADKAGKNIVFHSSVTGNITLDMVDTPINDAFALVLQIAGLSYYEKDKTLIIIKNDDAANSAFSKQEMMTFPVKYVSAAKIANFLNTNVFAMGKPGLSGAGAATVNAATNEIIIFGMPSDAAIVRKVIAQLDKEPSQRTFTVNHTTPAEMADMICNFLLPGHGVGGSQGGDSGFVPPEASTGGAAGIITGGAAGAEGGTGDIKIGEGIVACTVSQSASGGSNAPFDLQSIGISYYPQRGTILMIGGSEAQLQMVENFIRTNDIKQPQALLEMSIVELTEEGSKEFQNNWDFQAGNWGFQFKNGVVSGGRYGGYFDNGVNVTRYGWSDDSSQYVPYDKDGNFNQPQPWSASGLMGRNSLLGGQTYLLWQMNYLIENRKARVLSNPKILITNGQESIIDLTEDYVEKVTSEFLTSSVNGSSSNGTVQRTYTIGKDKGIKITLTPFISPDGYVTMNITPEYATEAGKVYSQSVTGENEIGATLLNRRNLALKNVRIKDGETLVIGGLIQEIEQKTVSKIPVLGDLPLVGAAFRSTKTSKGKGELVIMITPKILADGESIADKL